MGDGEAGRVRVHLPALVQDYTGGARAVELDAAETLGAVFDALEARFPGVRFRLVDEQRRVRRHVRVWIGEASAAALDAPVPAGVEVRIVGALSGG